MFQQSDLHFILIVSIFRETTWNSLKGELEKKKGSFSPCLKMGNNIVMERVRSLYDSMMNDLKMEELNEGIIN